MNVRLTEIQQAVADGRVQITDHALMRMVERHIDIVETLDGVARGKILEDYFVSRGEPRLLIEQRTVSGRTIQVVWEAPMSRSEIAVLVTVF